ncbi:hypothetical protein MNBD_GAMMA22-2411 [hydrothermal vent metagenome]|uniref:Rieske domain-containing protein n=1 Tax=hydrothermal vent metagenome TaxID=652676 RepID=A0A3B0ZZ74_9ZZZZ
MYICENDQLEELATIQFQYPHQDECRQGFVIKWQGNLYAYQNLCPHTGVELNWQQNVFLSFDQTMIQCATHGAQFQVSDGLCVWGPCLGQSLIALPVIQCLNKVYLVLNNDEVA